MRRGLTPSQTIGPFFHKALLRADGNDLTPHGGAGERVVIEGRVLDGDGAAVGDAMVEIWQANAAGNYPHENHAQGTTAAAGFHGFGRTGTDAEGRFSFRTIKPGAVREAGDFTQAPHINVTVFARGLLRQVVTRIYFADEALNAADPVLNAVPAARRDTLIAHRQGGAGARYHFEIRLQGEGETVFFDL